MMESSKANRALKAILFCLSFLLVSCASPPKPIATAGKSFLWSVRSGRSTVYLLGSIHVAKQDLYPLRKVIEEAFDRSDTLVVEVDTTRLDPAKLQALYLQYGAYTGGDTLDGKLSKETYALAETKLKKLGIGIQQFGKIKPWLLASILEVSELRRLGFDQRYGIDQYFLDRAEGKKRVLAFETFEYQINLFNSLSDRYQELFLLYTLSDLNLLAAEVDNLMTAWSHGDAGTVQAIVSENLTEHPELLPIYQKLIYERNKKMFSKIEQFLKTGNNYFVVVGAGHLVGKGGIIDLLRKKGYPVEQL
jgi:uncharacterized protein